MLLNNTIFHVVFGTCDPENASLVNILQMRKIHVRLIKYLYFATLEIQPEQIWFCGIVSRILLDDSKLRQKIAGNLPLTLDKIFGSLVVFFVEGVGKFKMKQV